MNTEIRGAVSVIEKDGKHFMIKQSKSKPLSGQWRHPGGSLESDEKPVDGLKREVMEETGMEIELIDEKPIVILKADYVDCYFGFFRARFKGSGLKIDEKEIADFGWFTMDQIRKLNLMNATRIFYDNILAKTKG